jgi:hypothetical protein
MAANTAAVSAVADRLLMADEVRRSVMMCQVVAEDTGQSARFFRCSDADAASSGPAKVGAASRPALPIKR